MNTRRSLMLIGITFTACTATTAVPVEVQVVEAPELSIDRPAQLLLDVLAGLPTDGIEIAIQGDAGVLVTDYAPKVLPATTPAAGNQVFVDLVPKSGGAWVLTVTLTLHVGGKQQTRAVTLPLAVSVAPAASPTP